jgi:hypothetical protein
VLEHDADQGWSVHDSGSLNGTAVLAAGLPPPVRLDAGARQTLRSNDVIELGGIRDVTFLFTAVSAAP